MMKKVHAAEMSPGESIVLRVKVINNNLRPRMCHPREVDRDEIVVGIDKTLLIGSVTVGESCKGVHINERRIPTTHKHRGKWVPNPDGRRLITHDGCWDKVAWVWIAS